MATVIGLLLTGGASSRMGRDKAGLCAERLAGVLAEVLPAAYEVGPGRTSLARLDDPGEGPLAAVAAAAGLGSDAVVLACDLPFAGAGLVGWLAGLDGTAVPVVEGRIQPLCARYAAADLALAAEVVAAGGRSMRDLLDRTAVQWLGPEAWGPVASAREFADVDTPEDLDRLGVAWP